VIDSTINGQATGGVRFGEKVSLEEVRELAAEMTLKFSFLNLALGGAKAGICCPLPLSPEQRKQLFSEFGKSLAPLLKEKQYQPGADMGTSGKDLEYMFNGAGISMNGHAKGISSGYYTAVSVFAALRAVTSMLDIPLKDLRISVQGVGKVGLDVIRLASGQGMKIAAVATRNGALYSSEGLNPEKIIALTSEYGDDMVFNYDGLKTLSSDEFFMADTDVLCPCAGSHPIHEANAENINAKIIIPGCNVAASSTVEEMLFKRGISYLPGFVCNSGGILCYLLSNYGFEEEELGAFLSEGIFHKVTRLLVRAKKANISPAQAAREAVSENQQRFTRESEHTYCGKCKQAYIRFRSCGIREMIRTAIWPLVQGALGEPPSAKKSIARKILFERLFMAICLFTIELFDFFPICAPI
jgi:glutamate dehydrogenase/leucine dehydrogenase